MLPAQNRWLWLVGAGVALPIDLAKSLQKEVASGRLKLGAMYEKIQKNLARKEFPKP